MTATSSSLRPSSEWPTRWYTAAWSRCVPGGCMSNKSRYGYFPSLSIAKPTYIRIGVSCRLTQRRDSSMNATAATPRTSVSGGTGVGPKPIAAGCAARAESAGPGLAPFGSKGSFGEGRLPRSAEADGAPGERRSGSDATRTPGTCTPGRGGRARGGPGSTSAGASPGQKPGQMSDPRSQVSANAGQGWCPRRDLNGFANCDRLQHASHRCECRALPHRGSRQSRG